MVTSPVSYTIALGGVATGSMNAKLGAIVVGSASMSGWMRSVSANARQMGMKTVAVAVFDDTSVMNVTHTVNTATIAIGGS